MSSGDVAPSEIDLQVADFKIEGAADEFLLWLKSKVERNLVELFAKSGKRVTHRLAASKPVNKARNVIAGSIGAVGADDAEVIAQLLDDKGSVVASVQFAAPRAFWEKNYKVIPDTLVYGLDIGVLSLTPLDTKGRPTNSLKAYAQFAQAKRLAAQQKLKEALEYLNAAVVTDPQFASAYWAAGQVHRALGDQSGAEAHEARAQAINLDHPKIPIIVGVSNPTPDMMTALSRTAWQNIADGFEAKIVEVKSYGLRVYAWRFDPARYAISVALQASAAGSNVKDLRQKHSALLAINGGFFKIDSEQRLTPDGFLVADGRQVSPYNSMAGSGLLYEQDGKIGIMWSKSWETLENGVESAVQAGPMVVDPGGKNGIYINDYNRHDRTSVCLREDGNVVVVIVKGGLSLFELGSLLAAKDKDGGMNCERAINLDGGPSTQASFAPSGSKPLEIEGIWRSQNAVLVHPR